MSNFTFINESHHGSSSSNEEIPVIVPEIPSDTETEVIKTTTTSVAAT